MVVYRYRGKFVSEARARALSHLRGPSRYVTTTAGPYRSARYVTSKHASRQAKRLAERMRRSEAAKRGWRTRRKRRAAVVVPPVRPPEAAPPPPGAPRLERILERWGLKPVPLERFEYIDEWLLFAAVDFIKHPYVRREGGEG